MADTRMRARLLLLTAALMLLVAGGIRLRAADGVKGKLIVYEANVAAEQGEWRFKVELEPVLFRLVTVQNKYKVLRININNRSKKPLKLSLAEDRIRVYLDANGGPNARSVDGFLDMARTDPAWWKSLDQTLKGYLAYPDQSSIKAFEEENVFVFVPADKLPALPGALGFTIKSFSDTPIMIAHRNVATAS